MSDAEGHPETRRPDAPDTRPLDVTGGAGDAPAPDTRPADQARPRASGTPPARSDRRPRWRIPAAIGAALIATATVGAGAEALVATALDGSGPIAWLTTAGTVLLAAALAAACLHEIRAIARLRRLGRLRERARAVLDGERADDPGLVDALLDLHEGRPDIEPALRCFRTNAEGVGDAANQVAAFDATVLPELDTRVECAAMTAIRRTITATAISPFPLLDAAVTTWTNLRLLRDVAVIHGGRPGALATVRLIRMAFANVLAAGVFESAHDALHDLIGSGLAGRLSTTTATAVTNGLLTARLALAAADVCRPVPRTDSGRPNARVLVRRAFADGFAADGGRPGDAATIHDDRP